MRVVVSTIGRFHSFNLAAQLRKRDSLAAIFTGYPRFKLRDAGVDLQKIRSFPWLQAPYMALVRFAWFQRWLERDWSWLAQSAHDRFVARNLPDCDAVIALSGMGLRTGLAARERGARYVCDRGSTHKLFQDRILREEYDRHGFAWPGIDPRSIARELAEYAEADAITVPSRFVHRTFVEQGVPEERLRLCPYGANLERFHPVMRKDEEFRVLFVGQMGLRKGLPDLLEGFRRAALPRARLVLVGLAQPETATLLARTPAANLEVPGLLHGEDLVREMARASVLVLPSIEEGLAMVMAEAMACGTPVVASTHTGAEDLFTDGVEGFIVPIRSPDAIAERLVRLACEPGLRDAMGRAARARVEGLGGWDTYGATMYAALDGLCRGTP